MMPRSGDALRLPVGCDRASFLRDYWQRRPLLMRAALDAAAFDLQPDELAGLACEPEFESRLVRQVDTADWRVDHGPFAAHDFAALPDSGWTLLVQDVDKYLPQVAALIDRFDFVPRWRIDDIMISYAVDGGGVGPHVDAYDVFLMQARGHRRWRISAREYSELDLLPDCEQRVLARFDTDEEWLLAPGDVLYLPPGVAHWGVAEGECMTWSLGFRTPDRRELAAEWFHWLIDNATDDTRLDDPPGLSADDLGLIPPAAADRAARLVDDLPDARSASFRRWLGRYFTEPKAQFQIEPPRSAADCATVRELLAQGRDLYRHPFARLAWTELPDGSPVLFFQGRDRLLAAGLAPLAGLLARQRRLANADLRRLVDVDADAQALLAALLNEGVLEAETD